MKSEELTYGEDIKGPIEFIVVKDKLILMTIEAKRQMYGSVAMVNSWEFI
ncbi:hypothetical protein BJ944DRAFT_242128 [Cunninghamella echinulata]|nr:hypothetical protein BJ944DRAFT_242128 [Cunninghamella echinulata]